MQFIMVPADCTGNPLGAGAGCLDNQRPPENVPREGLRVDSGFMLTFDEALARVLQDAPRLEAEIVALAEANGRVLAESVHAAFPLPPHDYSAMDGYALHTDGLTGDPPWSLPVRGESRTGRVASRLEPGSACRVFTGAEIPEGANTVVMQENVEQDGERVRFRVRPSEGDHVRRAGEDVAQGTVVLDQCLHAAGGGQVDSVKQARCAHGRGLLECAEM